MPLFETITHTYKHVWSDVSTGSWKKYPSPDRPDILSIDLLSKEINPETGVLKCTKLIICKGNTPTWLQSIMGASECFFYEETVVDPKNKIMQLRTKNLNFTNILGVEEVCTYTPHPDNPNEWTLFTQEAKVTSSIFGVARKMESFCLDRFKSNAHKGRKIMEDAILKVKMEAEESLASLDQTLSKVKQEAEESFAQFEATLDTIKQEAESVVFQKALLEENGHHNHKKNSKSSLINLNTRNSLMDSNNIEIENENTFFNSQQKSILLKSLLAEDNSSAIFDFDIKFLSNIYNEKKYII